MPTASQISECSFSSKMLFLSHIFPPYCNTETFQDFHIFYGYPKKVRTPTKKKPTCSLVAFLWLLRRKELSQSYYKTNDQVILLLVLKSQVLLFRPVSTLRAEVVFPEAKFGALTAFSKLRYSSYKNKVQIKY